MVLRSTHPHRLPLKAGSDGPFDGRHFRDVDGRVSILAAVTAVEIIANKEYSLTRFGHNIVEYLANCNAVCYDGALH